MKRLIFLISFKNEDKIKATMRLSNAGTVCYVNLDRNKTIFFVTKKQLVEIQKDNIPYHRRSEIRLTADGPDAKYLRDLDLPFSQIFS